MENSYRAYSGIESTNMENGSLGVMKAARIRITTKADFRNPFNCFRVRMPMLERTSTTVGNSNSRPIRNTMDVNREIYELKEIVFCTVSLTV